MQEEMSEDGIKSKQDQNVCTQIFHFYPDPKFSVATFVIPRKHPCFRRKEKIRTGNGVRRGGNSGIRRL